MPSSPFRKNILGKFFQERLHLIDGVFCGQRNAQNSGYSVPLTDILQYMGRHTRRAGRTSRDCELRANTLHKALVIKVVLINYQTDDTLAGDVPDLLKVPGARWMQ